MNQLALPMTPTQALKHVIVPALQELGPKYDSPRARLMLTAIALQESDLAHRRQQPGPARGLWQFEQGGGVRGVLNHPSSKRDAARLCELHGVAATPAALYAALEHDDVLAAGIARLLLWTLPQSLPAPGDADAAWAQYLDAWRPGKPHRNRWTSAYRAAMAAVS